MANYRELTRSDLERLSNYQANFPTIEDTELFNLFTYVGLKPNNAILSADQTINEMEQTIHNAIDSHLPIVSNRQKTQICDLCDPPKTFYSKYRMVLD